MEVVEILTAYKDLGFFGLLIMVITLVGRHILSQNKACYEKYEEHVKAHKDEIKDLTGKMFEVVSDNTRATIALQKTIDHMDTRLSSGLNKFP